MTQKRTGHNTFKRGYYIRTKDTKQKSKYRPKDKIKRMQHRNKKIEDRIWVKIDVKDMRQIADQGL